MLHIHAEQRHMSPRRSMVNSAEGPGAMPFCDGIWGWDHTDLKDRVCEINSYRCQHHSHTSSQTMRKFY